MREERHKQDQADRQHEAQSGSVQTRKIIPVEETEGPCSTAPNLANANICDANTINSRMS